MATQTRNEESEPLMFSNAPTEVYDGRRYLTDDAARELSDRVAKRYETLLEKLAQE